MQLLRTVIKQTMRYADNPEAGRIGFQFLWNAHNRQSISRQSQGPGSAACRRNSANSSSALPGT
jgi:hypothetical protein